MPNQNPEQIARDNIDKQLRTCGWIIQDIKRINLNAGVGLAVKEYQTDAVSLLFDAEEICKILGKIQITMKKNYELRIKNNDDAK